MKATYTMAVPYLNLVDSEERGYVRSETTTRLEMLQRNLASDRVTTSTTGVTRFSLVGTPVDSILGQLVSVKIS
jgi:hypothetical protein